MHNGYNHVRLSYSPHRHFTCYRAQKGQNVSVSPFACRLFTVRNRKHLPLNFMNPQKKCDCESEEAETCTTVRNQQMSTTSPDDHGLINTINVRLMSYSQGSRLIGWNLLLLSFLSVSSFSAVASKPVIVAVRLRWVQIDDSVLKTSRCTKRSLLLGGCGRRCVCGQAVINDNAQGLGQI